MVNNNVGEMMTYPMALAKQTKPEYYLRQQGRRKYPINFPTQLPVELIQHIFTYDDGVVDNEQCDIDIIFSPDAEWFFGDGRISDNQVDFRLTAAREITRGLGIYSNFDLDGYYPNKYSIMDPSTTFLSYMSPWDSLIYGIARTTKRNFPTTNWTNTVSFLASPRDMASYIPRPGEKRPLSYIMNKFQNSGLYGKNVTDLVMYTHEQPSPISRNDIAHKDWRMDLNWDRHAARVFSVSEKKKFESVCKESQYYTHWQVQVNGVPILYLEETKHRDLFRDSTEREEFLMSTSSFKGKNFDTILSEHEFKLYGPRTLRVLEEIGHATPSNPRTLVFYEANNHSTRLVEQKRISPEQFKKKLLRNKR